MDTSVEYQIMCMKCFEIQGYLNVDRSKDIKGILHERGLKKGDFILMHHTNSSHNNIQEVNVCHVDFNIVNQDDGEIFYLEGREMYNYIQPLLGFSHCMRVELNFPVWKIQNLSEDNSDPFRHLFYYLQNGYYNQCIWWLPRQDQLQELIWNKCYVGKMIGGMNNTIFNRWLMQSGLYISKYSLEMLWLMFYMKEAHRKEWTLVSSENDYDRYEWM